jgi:uncharacterized membrane protein
MFWSREYYWSRWYATRSYLRSALWLVPLVALVLEQVAINLIFVVGPWLTWIPQYTMPASGATQILDTVEALAFSFTVFTFGSLLVAIQIASGQLTPRIIATALLRNNVIRLTVGLFIFTFLFSVGTQARVDTTVPRLALTLTVILGIASIMMFLFLIDYTARLLRPINILWRIGEQGMEVIESVYPDLFSARNSRRDQCSSLGPAERTITHQRTSAIVLAVNIGFLVTAAQEAGGIIEFVPRVGDFVAVGQPLFRLYGDAAKLDDRIAFGQVAFGSERTIEQDALFAFRVIVDVAIKALSPAINDPTTAVLAIDQLSRLLRLAGQRHLHNNALYGSDGRLRLIFPTPDWNDFVQLAFSEIRIYGAGNFQIARRLRAMIEDLEANLPQTRQPALQRELALLDHALEKHYPISADLELAREPDMQGLGGRSGRS